MIGGITYLNGIKQSDDIANNLFTLGYIDKNKKTAIEGLEIILCKPNEEEICVLSDAFDIDTSMVFKDLDSLSFSIPYYVSEQYQQVKNPNWDLIRDGFLIKFNNQKIFIITSIEEDGDTKDTKYVTCESREWQLGKRMLRGFSGTRQLYKSAGDGTVTKISYTLDGTNWTDYTTPFTTDDNKDIGVKIYDIKGALINTYIWNNNDKLLQTPDILITYNTTDVVNKKIQVTMKIIAETGEGIMNLLEEQTSWRIGFIDDDIREDKSLGQDHRKYRTFDISEKSWLSFIKEDIQESFDCVVIFDTINKIINFYSVDNLTQNKGLYISEDNYLKSIKKHTKDDEIITRLSVYGKNNLTIASVNPTGKLYIEDFSYYRNLDYMPQELLDALNDYDALIVNKTPIFYNYLQDQSNLFNKKIQLNNQLVDLQYQLTKAQDAIDAAIQTAEKNKDRPTVVTGIGANGFDVTAELSVNFSDIQPKDLSELNKVRDDIQALINNKKLEIESNNNDLLSKQKQIQNLADEIAKENNFTEQQIKLLDEFVKEKTWSNANYSDPKDLMAAAKNALDGLSKPIIEFDIDLVDLLNLVECQYDWDKLKLGDIINVFYDKFNISVELRIMKISHKIDSNNLSILVSNKDEVDNTAKYLSDIMRAANEATSTLNIFKHEWDLSSSNQDLISNIINNALDTGKNRVLSGRNQNISIDERGIALKDMDSNQEQLRMLNNIIAFTQDGWKSCSLAITPQGIVAEQIYGKIIGSNKLIITNMNDNGESSFLVDGDHMKAINMDLSLENKTHLNRLYLNPEVGIKIQKRPTTLDDWQDALFLDNNGEIWAKAFHVINTNSVLDDTGLKIYNGNLWVYNEKGDNVFNVNTNGETDSFGRFRVFRYSGTSKVTLADMYKDESRGGKLMINDWNGNINAFLGSSPNSSYTGGFLKLYNGSTTKERVEIGTYSSNDMGVINIKNNNSINIIEINGNSKGGTINLKNSSQRTQIHISSMDDSGANSGIIELNGTDGSSKLILRAKSDSDNMGSSGRTTGGLIQFTSYDNSTNYFLTVNQENNFGLYDMNKSAIEINKHSDSVILNHKNRSNVSLFDGGIHLLVEDRSKFRVAQGTLDASGNLQNGIDFGMPCIVGASTESFAGVAGKNIPFPKSLGNTNYVVVVTPSGNTGGYVGEIWTVKTSTSCTVYNSGLAQGSFDYMILAY